VKCFTENRSLFERTPAHSIFNTISAINRHNAGYQKLIKVTNSFRRFDFDKTLSTRSCRLNSTCRTRIPSDRYKWLRNRYATLR